MTSDKCLLSEAASGSAYTQLDCLSSSVYTSNSTPLWQRLHMFMCNCCRPKCENEKKFASMRALVIGVRTELPLK